MHDKHCQDLVAVSTWIYNIETEGTGAVSSIVRACDTDVSHQNRTDDLNLAQSIY